MPVWGNHEWDDEQSDDLRNYKGRFALPHAAASPGAPAAGCCGEDWYWFDQGAVRFIIYPEPYTAETWPDWARKAEPLFAAAQADGADPLHRHRRPPARVQLGPPRRRTAAARDPRRFRQALRQVRPQPERPRPRLRTHEAAVARRPRHRRDRRRLAGARRDTRACGPTASRRLLAFRAIHHGFVKLTVRDDGIALEAICAGAAPKEDIPPLPRRRDHGRGADRAGGERARQYRAPLSRARATPAAKIGRPCSSRQRTTPCRSCLSSPRGAGRG